LNDAATGTPAPAGQTRHWDDLRNWLSDTNDPLLPILQPAKLGKVSQSDDSDFSYTVPAALDLLAEMDSKEAGAQGMSNDDGQASDQRPLAQLRAQLKAGARSPGQLLAIDVVARLMAQITQDARLLAPVRQAIAAAEPAYLRLALADPRFFSSKNHPARRLLDALTGQSLRYPDTQAPGFAGFLQDIEQALVSLDQGGGGEAAHFARAFKLFDDRQKQQQAPGQAQHGQAVQALLQAERRNLLAEKMAVELRARPGFESLNAVIAGFLTGPWVQVMAQEKLLKPAEADGVDKGVFSRLVRDLLWSLNPEPSPKHRRRLLTVIPDILATLREGLVFIDYPLAQSKPFFEELMAIHQTALQPSASRPPTPAVQASAVPRGPVDFQPSEPWLAPAEARQSGFLDIGMESPVQPPQPAPVSAPQAGPVAGPADLVADLRPGAWIELTRDGVVLRAQLTWASPHNTLFMFASAGGRTHSMTRRALERLQQAGALRTVAAEGMVEHAFDSAARKAMPDAGGDPQAG